MALPTRYENVINVQRDYLALGDSHNPADPKFAAFRDSLLKQYNVTRVEDLPVNLKGLVSMEGERRSTELFNRYAASTMDRQEEQSRLIDHAGWLSPALALRRLSMTASGTDLASFRSFLEQGEAYRYALIQGLNKLHAEEVHYADDGKAGKENRISNAHWQGFPPFHYRQAQVDEILVRAAPAGAALVLWILALTGLTWWLAGRLGRAVR